MRVVVPELVRGVVVVDVQDARVHVRVVAVVVAPPVALRHRINATNMTGETRNAIKESRENYHP